MAMAVFMKQKKEIEGESDRQTDRQTEREREREREREGGRGEGERVTERGREGNFVNVILALFCFAFLLPLPPRLFCCSLVTK